MSDELGFDEDSHDEHADSEIAIVGMSGRFPGSPDLASFWRHLRRGVESIAHFSEQELVDAGVARRLLSHPQYIRAFGYLDNIELFDAAFFGISAEEAEITDPQHRLFLECAWQALEDAGCDPDRPDGPIGVFAGLSTNNYRDAHTTSVDSTRAALGNLREFLPTRVSYRLNLKGPSINVQTGCSSSLVAVHLACQSLLNGECDLALAGGVSISALHKRGYLYKEGGKASPDGHCRAYDAGAQGTVGGDGLGIVVLKSLPQALADGYRVHAVIRGSAINNDGSAKVGYTAPSVEGQAAVTAEAQAVAEVTAESVTYIEGHGTGTQLGDPVEIDALTRAFRRGGAQKKGFCALGSVKTNIGYLEEAAGIAGLIKTVLALKHRELPPSLHFEKPNPAVDLPASPFFVNDRLRSWARGETPRRAGVSAYGVGGTNAHVVLEEAATPEPESTSRSEHLLLISAKSPEALEAATSNLAEALREGSVSWRSGAALADVAHTLQLGRQAFLHRRFVVARDPADAASALESRVADRIFTRQSKSGNPSVVFMFPGEGSQQPKMGWQKMALKLYEEEPVFRREVDRCCRLLEPHLDLDLRPLLYPAPDAERTAADPLRHTNLKQPTLFTVEFALAKLWMQWGVEPKGMIGHGVGEWVAACLAGVMTLEEALALVALRGRLTESLPSGASPTLEAFAQEVSQVELQPPEIPFISNLTGTWITEREAVDPDYWSRHSRPTARFEQGLERLLADNEQILLEVLLGSLPQPGTSPLVEWSWLATLGHLWLTGVQLNWSGCYLDERRVRTGLPTYPFERRRYWLDPRDARAGRVDLPQMLSSLKAFGGGVEEIDSTSASSFLETLAAGQKPDKGAFKVTVNWDGDGADNFEFSLKVVGGDEPQLTVTAEQSSAAEPQPKSRSVSSLGELTELSGESGDSAGDSEDPPVEHPTGDSP